MPSARQVAGSIGEAVCAARLLANGYVVLTPSTPEPYDLVAVGMRFHKIQVKARSNARSHGRSSRYNFTIERCGRVYQPSECDFVVLVALDADICWVLPIKKALISSVAINPNRPGKYDKYVEAWHLLK